MEVTIVLTAIVVFAAGITIGRIWDATLLDDKYKEGFEDGKQHQYDSTLPKERSWEKWV